MSPTARAPRSTPCGACVHEVQFADELVQQLCLEWSKPREKVLEVLHKRGQNRSSSGGRMIAPWDEPGMNLGQRVPRAREPPNPPLDLTGGFAMLTPPAAQWHVGRAERGRSLVQSRVQTANLLRSDPSE